MTNIAYIRKKLGLSQQKMAAMMGVDQSSISRMEHGKCETTVNQVKKLRDQAKKRRMPWRDAWVFASFN